MNNYDPSATVSSRHDHELKNEMTKRIHPLMYWLHPRAALALFAVLASSMLRRCSSSASLASMRYAVCPPKQRMQSGGPAQNAQSSSEFFAILE